MQMILSCAWVPLMDICVGMLMGLMRLMEGMLQDKGIWIAE